MSARRVEKFLRHGEGHLAYPTSIGIFSSNGASVGRASKDGGVLAGDLQRLLTNVHGFNCAEEGLGRDGEFAMTVYGTDVPAGLYSRDIPEARVTNCLNERFKLSVSTLNRLAREEVEIPGREILIWIGPGWPRLSAKQRIPQGMFPVEGAHLFGCIFLKDLLRRDALAGGGPHVGDVEIVHTTISSRTSRRSCPRRDPPHRPGVRYR